MAVRLEDMHITSLTNLADLSKAHEGTAVRVRGFVDVVRKGRSELFVIVRDVFDTVQCVVPRSAEDADSIAQIKPEAYIEVAGNVVSVATPVRGCTKGSFEIHARSTSIVSPVTARLPFLAKDAAVFRRENDADADAPACAVSYTQRLDNRFLDLRLRSTQAIFRLVDTAMQSFREYLRARDFVEIKSTKIIAAGSEGGANLFEMQYFKKPAFLAQSPQLYKQLAIAGGMKRVFEIGHVYRAEEQNVNRYLSEFTGVDLEMELTGSYLDTIRFIYRMFVHVFESLKARTTEIEAVRAYNPFTDIVYAEEPVIITHAEAVQMLRAAGQTIGDLEDFSRKQESTLGELVKKAHGVDFFVVRDYPQEVRAFYAYAEPGATHSHSYDFILRGIEILSGAERQTNHEALVAAVRARGIPEETLRFYLDAFQYGVPPHAGCGIGLERFLMTYFALDDIRHFALFPRDKNRLAP